MSAARKHDQTIVIGAGVIGVCSALALQRLGREVVLVDSAEPGHGASYGNAGVIAADAIDPLASAANLLRAPAMLIHRDGPLVMPPRHLARLLPWLARFVRAAAPGAEALNRHALWQLNRTALAAWRRLLAPLGLDAELVDSGFLHVWQSTNGARQAARRAAELAQWGIPAEEVDGDGLAELEPRLSRRLSAGLLLSADAQMRDPHRLVGMLFDAFAQRGGRFHRTHVHGITPAADTGFRLRIGDARIETTELVVAAGAFSHRLLAPLGLTIPLETERGYHLTLPGLHGLLSRPVCSADRHCVITPLATGLRIVGFSELGGLELPPVERRHASLRRQLGALVDDRRIATEPADNWMGFRPTLPDSLPVIDEHPEMPGLFMAFGHQHLGLTQAATTAEQLALLVARRATGFDLSPYRATRFR